MAYQPSSLPLTLFERFGGLQGLHQAGYIDPRDAIIRGAKPHLMPLVPPGAGRTLRPMPPATVPDFPTISMRDAIIRGAKPHLMPLVPPGAGRTLRPMPPTTVPGPMPPTTVPDFPTPLGQPKRRGAFTAMTGPTLETPVAADDVPAPVPDFPTPLGQPKRRGAFETPVAPVPDFPTIWMPPNHPLVPDLPTTLPTGTGILPHRRTDLFGQGIPQEPPGIPSGGHAPGMADQIMSLQPSDPGLHLLGLGARPLGLPKQVPSLPPGLFVQGLPPGPPGISPGLPPSPSPLQPATGLGIPGLSAIGTPGGLSPLGTGLQPAIGTPGAPMPLPQQQAAPSALPFPNQFTGLGQGNIPPGGIGTFGNAFRDTLQWPFGPM